MCLMMCELINLTLHCAQGSSVFQSVAGVALDCASLRGDIHYSFTSATKNETVLS